jgi:NAD(P)-dependent dehydrogenase (short-subunit alcohol dehydrogenase family)
MNRPTVFISGANRGVGLALARRYHRDGWRILAGCRNPEAAADLSALGAHVERLDIADPATIDAATARLRGQAIDLLIANAGILGEQRPLGRLESNDFMRAIQANALGSLLLAQALLPQVAAGAGKRIVAISSRMGSIANALEEGGDYAYRCSKAALNMAMATLAFDLRPRGITVAVLHPGWAMTDMGGPEADVPVADSANGIHRVIEGLTMADTGSFFSWTGEAIPW